MSLPAPLRAPARAVAFTGLVLAFAPAYLVGRSFGRRGGSWTVRLACRLACAVAGLRLSSYGRPSPAAAGPTLYVANHVSYLDIPLIGALIDATFVAKREVRGWPVFGWFGRLVGTAFIDRSPGRAREAGALLRGRLRAGESLVLFPEGTSGDGSRVLPFKTAAFEAIRPERGGGADDVAKAVVQPVSIAFLRLRDGRPFDEATRPLYAWFGDMSLVPHLWRVLGQPGAEVVVHFHPPFPASAFADRKELARRAQEEVAGGLRFARHVLAAEDRARAEDVEAYGEPAIHAL